MGEIILRTAFFPEGFLRKIIMMMNKIMDMMIMGILNADALMLKLNIALV